ncbi:MAG: transposase [Phycisphaerales bacterium]
MERELWNAVVRMLDRARCARPKRCQFTDIEVARVCLWAALHDRPLCWACRAASWPIHMRKRRLPSPSTISRRVRRLGLLKLLRRALRSLCSSDASPRLILDGKPLAVSAYSKDGQAAWGFGVRDHARGYKLHVICDEHGAILAFALRPMNEAECVVARRLVSKSAVRGAEIYADASYDSNPLHATVDRLGMRLWAPRRRPGAGLGQRVHHPARLRCIERLEGDKRFARACRRRRQAVERCFGNLTSFGGGLAPLPAWVRSLRRVRLWVIAKLLINSARIRLAAVPR